MKDKEHKLGLPFEYQQMPVYFEMLKRNGFDVVGQYDLNGNDFVAEKSLNILIVARKYND